MTSQERINELTDASDFKTEALIINRPDLVPSGQKLTAWSITLVFWGALLYLWQPLLSILAWGLNIRLFYNHMILLGGYQTFLNLLTIYLSVIATLGGALVLWARVNQWRFRGRERRRDIGLTDMALFCEEMGIAPDDLTRVGECRVVVVSFNDKASDKIAGITPGARVSNEIT